MSSFMLGLFATLLVGVYFGFYLVKLHSIPLGIIFVGIYVLAWIDFITTTRNSQKEK